MQSGRHCASAPLLSGAQGNANAAQSLVAKAVGDPSTITAARSLAEKVLAVAAAKSVSSLFAGRRLLGEQVRLDTRGACITSSCMPSRSSTQKSCHLHHACVYSSLVMKHGCRTMQLKVCCGMVQPSTDAVVDAVVSNPAVQAAAVHVAEAADTEINAMHALSAGSANRPAAAPAQVLPEKLVAVPDLLPNALCPCTLWHVRTAASHPYESRLG